jgi:hypothetical protein
MHPSGVIPESAIMMVDSDCPDWHATIMTQESEESRPKVGASSNKKAS